MPRPPRAAAGGVVYHVLNRANARQPLFERAADFAAFEHVLAQALDLVPLELFAYCVMPNHWHMVVRPSEDGALSACLGWLTKTHTQRWHAAHDTVGTGHLYQGRFKSFPVQDDGHLLTVCRYVERNPLRAALVPRAEAWRWSSLWRRTWGDDEAQSLLTTWPVSAPRPDLDWINAPQTDAELQALRCCAQRGRPFGNAPWVNRTADVLGLGSTLRDRGRPRRDA